jgi:lipopolysaccharide exporter
VSNHVDQYAPLAPQRNAADRMSINRSMAKGAAWMIAVRMFNRGVGAVSTLILARLLVPADFGLVAMATVLLQLLMAVSDFSVHVPLVQKESIDDEDMNSAWSLQFAVGAAQAACLALLAYPVAGFYDEPRLVEVVLVLAVIALLKGYRNIGIVMFVRNMTFDRDFVMMATKRIITFVVTVAAAWHWRSYWALIAGMLSGAVAELYLSYHMHPYRPSLSVARWGALFRFSRWLLLNNLLAFIGQRGPDLVLGRLLGPRAVGLFSVANEIAMLPTTELVTPINRAALPAYSRLRQEDGGLRRGYLDVIGVVALVALPAGVGIAATAEVLVPLLLGAKWLDVVPLMKYLAVTGALGTLLANSGAVFLALGRPQTNTALLATRVTMLVPAMVAGARWQGINGVAMAYFAVSCVMACANLGVVTRVLGIPLGRFLAILIRPLVAAAAMFGLVRMLLLKVPEATPLTVSAAAAVVAGAVSYAGCIITLWWLAGRPAGAERKLWGLFVELVARRAPALARRLRGGSRA